MKVSDLMTKDMVTVDVGSSTRDVARLMAEKNVGSVLVTENRKVKGLVTDRSLVVHVMGRDLNPDEVPVRNVMTDNPVCCKESDTVFDAAKQIVKSGPFRRLPVVNDREEPVGILSIADLALVCHPLMEAVLMETEASVAEVKVEELGLKKDLWHSVPREARVQGRR